MKLFALIMLAMISLSAIAEDMPTSKLISKPRKVITLAGMVVPVDMDGGYRLFIENDFYHISYEDLKAAIAEHCKGDDGVNKCH